MREASIGTLKKVIPYIAVLVVGMLLGSFILGEGDVPGTPGEPIPNEPTSTGYTCSMHPDVLMDHAGTCPLCGMELVERLQPASLLPGQFEMKEEALALANVETLRISGQTGGDWSMELSGQIRTNERTNTIQTTLFEGRIDRLDISAVGEYVRKGQEIGLIYSPELYLAQDKLLTSSSYKDTHVKLYKASRYGLGLWKLTDEQIDEIIRTGEPMLHFPMVADVSGTVTEIRARVGNFYKEGDPLFVLSDLRTVWAVFDAYENQIGHLKEGQKVLIHTEAFRSEPVEARIDFIEPVIDGARRTASVRVVLKNKEEKLKPGMFVNAEVSIENGNQGIWLPRSAVLWTGKRSLVYIKDSPGRPVFEAREITLGSTTGDAYEVLEGLEIGEEVVVNGTFTIDAAAQLNRKSSMMRPGSDSMMPIRDGAMGPFSKQGETQAKFQQAILLYLDIKNALVSDEPSLAREHAKQTIELLNTLQANNGIEGDWPTSAVEVQDLLERISRAESIDQQRSLFKPLSGKFIELAMSMGNTGNTLYVQFCPMADNNAGGYWLSLEEEITNPYFGDQMLRCGKVTDVIE